MSLIVDFFQWDGWAPTIPIGIPSVGCLLAAFAMWSSAAPLLFVVPFVVVGILGLVGLALVLLDY